MERIRTEPARTRRTRRRVVAALAGSGLLAALLLAWTIVSATPRSVQAAVQDGLGRAASAHLVILVHDETGRSTRSDVWYRRAEGFRMNSPERVLVENGRDRWTWDPRSTGADRLIVRQPSITPFVDEIGRLIDLDELPPGWTRARSPEFDAVIAGSACQGFRIAPPTHDPSLPPGARPVDPRPIRAIYLSDAEGLVHRITTQREAGTGWRAEREITIGYDEPVSPVRIAANFPEGVRFVDRDRIFEGRYPLDRALSHVEVGGLILAVHDLRPLADGEVFFVVSSVRGTASHLRRFPPHRRMINTEVDVLEVASQPVTNRILSDRYDLIGLASAAREGVEYAWWMIVPRRFFRGVDGRKVFESEAPRIPPTGEPDRLDEIAGHARILLRATYDDSAHRGPGGVPLEVERWAAIPLPPDPRPLTLEVAAARTRADLRLMRHAGIYSMLGVAADARAAPSQGRPLSDFDPEATTDAEYAAAVRRGLEDLRAFDQVAEPESLPEEAPR